MSLRITVTVKGELEEFVREEMERLGEAAGTVCKQLCQQGMEYKKSLRTMSVLAAAIEKQQPLPQIKKDGESK